MVRLNLIDEEVTTFNKKNNRTNETAHLVSFWGLGNHTKDQRWEMEKVCERTVASPRFRLTRSKNQSVSSAQKPCEGIWTVRVERN